MNGNPDFVYCKCVDCGGTVVLTNPLMKDIHRSTVETPWAVTCRKCGLVFLTNHGYNQQMKKVNHLWDCPRCYGPATWSDTNYEKFLKREEEGKP